MDDEIYLCINLYINGIHENLSPFLFYTRHILKEEFYQQVRTVVKDLRKRKYLLKVKFLTYKITVI